MKGGAARMIHELKVWPDFFPALEDGSKPFELRWNDRGFMEGDTLRLREWSPQTRLYTGREVLRCVTYVLRKWEGLSPGFVVLGLAPPDGMMRMLLR